MFPQRSRVSAQNFFEIFTRQRFSETVLIDGVFASPELQQVFKIKRQKLILRARHSLWLLPITPAE